MSRRPACEPAIERKRHDLCVDVHRTIVNHLSPYDLPVVRFEKRYTYKGSEVGGRELFRQNSVILRKRSLPQVAKTAAIAGRKQLAHFFGLVLGEPL